jgi:Reverse transcriptase (RNA-dependent DNA polymerase)
VPQGQHLTAYQLFWRVAPSVQHLRVIGCLAYVLVPDTPARKKLDARAVPAVFVGYNMHCKAYRFLLRDRSGRMHVLVRRDAVFDERRCGWPLLSQDPIAIQKLLLTDWQHAEDVRRQLLGPHADDTSTHTLDDEAHAPTSAPLHLHRAPCPIQLDPPHDPQPTSHGAARDADMLDDGSAAASDHAASGEPAVSNGDGDVHHDGQAAASDCAPTPSASEHTVPEGGGAAAAGPPAPSPQRPHSASPPLSTAPARRVAPARRELPARNRQPVQGVHNKLWNTALLTAVSAPSSSQPSESGDDTLVHAALRDALPEVAAALLAQVMPHDASDGHTHTEADDEDDKPAVRKALRGKYAVEWMQAILRELFQLQQHGTWVVGAIPPGVTPTPCMWVLVRKRDADGRIEKYKARLVFRGDLQDEQEFDETFAPTGRMDAVRLFFALVCIHDLDWVQMDVSNAFLNGVLDKPVHMQFPPLVGPLIQGFGLGTCCILDKTIYGLRQACREWRMVLDAALQSARIQLKPTDKDPTIYTKEVADGFVMMKVWTDDMLIAGKGLPIVQDICSEVEQCWNTHYLGEPKQFVGIRIDRDRAAGTLTISQPKLIAHILQITRMDKANPTHTPMDPGTRLEDPGELNPAFTLHGCSYPQLVGKLNYLVQCTRPDLAFAVSQLARHQAHPGKHCWDALKRVLRYLAGTRNLGITYNRNAPSDLTMYTDADFANRTDRRSVGAYVAMMAGGAVAWKSKLQSVIATSTAHSEHLAAYEAVCQTTYMRDLLTQMGFLSEGAPPIPLLCDNEASISVSQLEGVTNRNKHWEVKLFYVRQQQRSGVVGISHVPTNDNLADALTKALPAPQLRSLMHGMGMRRRV